MRFEPSAPAGGPVVDRDRPLLSVRIPSTVNTVVIRKPSSPLGADPRGRPILSGADPLNRPIVVGAAALW